MSHMRHACRILNKPALKVPEENEKFRCAEKDNKWLNKKSVRKCTDESSSFSEESCQSSNESGETSSGLSDVLTNIFADTDDSEEEVEGFQEEHTHENTDFKGLQTNNGIQDELVGNCLADVDKKQIGTLRRISDEPQLDLYEEDSDELSIKSDDNQSDLSDILATIFVDTDDNEEEFECFRDENASESRELFQSSSDELQSVTSQKNSDEESVESDESQSGLSEIIASIFADNEESDEEREAFKNNNFGEKPLTQEDYGMTQEESRKEHCFVINTPASNEVREDLFSDYTSDEEMKIIKNNIAECCLLDAVLSNEEETK